MKILYLDTETTGLIKDFKAEYNERTLSDGTYPYVIELAYQLVDYDDNLRNPKELAYRSVVLKPDFAKDWFETEVDNVTGISYEDMEGGNNKAFEIGMLMSAITRSDLIVAHNAPYDMKCIKADMLRLGIYEHLRVRPWFCTMKNFMKFVGARSEKGRLKFPRLEELYESLYGNFDRNAHRAYDDIETLRMCFEKLIEIGMITLPYLTDYIDYYITSHEYYARLKNDTGITFGAGFIS